MRKLSIAKKISLIVFITFLCLILLEIGLRGAGFILLEIKEFRNNMFLKAKKECVILCLRDSADRWGRGESWPYKLEEILNKRNSGISFKVIDRGIDAIPSSAILYALDEDIDLYKPDIVITMMGVYDGERSASFEEIFDTKIQSFSAQFKLYSLAKLLFSKMSKIVVSKPTKESKYLEAKEVLDKDMNEAKVALIKEIEMEPNNYQLYASLGHFCFAQGKFQQAEEMFKKSIEIHPDNDSSYNGLGDCYYSRQNYAQAEEMFKKALEINPDNENAFFDLINTYQKQGKFQQVEEMFKIAIERDPNNEKRYLQLGYFYNTIGIPEQAEAMFKKAIEINPDNQEGYSSLGQVYIAQDKLQQAEEILKRMQDEFRYLNSGLIYKVQGRYKEAEKELKKAIEVAVYNFDAYVALGDNYAKQGRYLEAEKALQKAIEISPDIPKAYSKLADVYRDQGKYLQAEEMLERATGINPGYAEAYIQLGRCYMDQKRYKEAIGVFEKGIALSPNQNENIYVSLALCYSERRLADELRQEGLLKQAIKANSSCSPAYLELGRLYIKQARYQDAEELLKKAIELNPKDITAAALELGHCYIKQGNSDKLQELLGKILSSKIKDDRIYSFLAVNYKARGDLESAERFFNEADASRLNYYSPQTYYNYRRLRDSLTKKNIRLVCVQYPMRKTEPLKKLFDSTEGIIFVDNEKVFKEALGHSKYEDYFEDYFAGDFGRSTARGDELLAQNIAEVILKELF
ncbi:MAG: tetratricopeptide repeat protein [Candidatus Omnitrophica bacterium]|nr:tetratricopeptide repeat protein [Candidatus Omnitrophota bacterium]